MFLTFVVICTCLLQDFTLQLTDCQKIREDSCVNDASVEDLMTKIKHLLLDSMDTKTQLKQLNSVAFQCDEKQKQLERKLVEAMYRFNEAEKLMGKICKSILIFKAFYKCMF